VGFYLREELLTDLRLQVILSKMYNCAMTNQDQEHKSL